MENIYNSHFKGMSTVEDTYNALEEILIFFSPRNF